MISFTLATALAVRLTGAAFLTSGTVVVAIRISLALKLFDYTKCTFRRSRIPRTATNYLSVLMPNERVKSHSSGFRNKIPGWDLFVAEAYKRGYNRAVRASPVVVAGYCMPPITPEEAAARRLSRGGL